MFNHNNPQFPAVAVRLLRANGTVRSALDRNRPPVGNPVLPASAPVGTAPRCWSFDNMPRRGNRGAILIVVNQHRYRPQRCYAGGSDDDRARPGDH